MKSLLAALILSLAATTATAQFAVYGMGSAGKLSGFNSSASSTGPNTTSGNFWAYGGTFGVYDDFLRLGPLKLGADARGFVQKSSNSNTVDSQLRGGFGGLRVSLHAPLVPFKPYIQAEIGGVGTNYGQNTIQTTKFGYQVQLGGDFTIFPHLDLRAEYGVGQAGSRYSSTSVTLQQLGAGAVVRF
jgi:opacity protein-like surface antigen